MSAITITFEASLSDAVLAGVIIRASRPTALGVWGDTFEAFAATFEVVRVVRQSIFAVRARQQEEGATGHDDLVTAWNTAYPATPLRRSSRVYVHQFRKV